MKAKAKPKAKKKPSRKKLAKPVRGWAVIFSDELLRLGYAFDAEHEARFYDAHFVGGRIARVEIREVDDD